MLIKNMKITDVRPYDKNPRFNDDAVDAVAKSIQEFGWRAPIVVDRDMVIICGHTRLKAAIKTRPARSRSGTSTCCPASCRI